MIRLWVVLGALFIILALKVEHDRREHARVLRAERERFEALTARRTVMRPSSNGHAELPPARRKVS